MLSFPLQFYLHVFEEVLLGVYTFGIVLSSRWVGFFIIVYCSFLSFIIFFVLKSTLHVLTITKLAFTWLSFSGSIFSFIVLISHLNHYIRLEVLTAFSFMFWKFLLIGDLGHIYFRYLSICLGFGLSLSFIFWMLAFFHFSLPPFLSFQLFKYFLVFHFNLSFHLNYYFIPLYRNLFGRFFCVFVFGGVFLFRFFGLL